MIFSTPAGLFLFPPEGSCPLHCFSPPCRTGYDALGPDIPLYWPFSHWVALTCHLLCSEFPARREVSARQTRKCPCCENCCAYILCISQFKVCWRDKMLCGLFGCAVALFLASLIASLAFLLRKWLRGLGCLLHLCSAWKAKAGLGRVSQLRRLHRPILKFRGELQPKNLGLKDEVFGGERNHLKKLTWEWGATQQRRWPELRSAKTNCSPRCQLSSMIQARVGRETFKVYSTNDWNQEFFL